MASVATIPFGLFGFEGLIINFVIVGKEERFATYNFSKVKRLEVWDDGCLLVISKGKLELTIKATIKNIGVLKSPRLGNMDQTIKEGLGGEIEVILKDDNKIIFEDIGTHAGIEIEWD